MLLPGIGAKLRNSTPTDPHHDAFGLGKVADFAPSIFGTAALLQAVIRCGCSTSALTDGWLDLGEFLLSCPGLERNSAIPRPPICTTTCSALEKWPTLRLAF